jgi:hypothetical protein
MSHVDQRAGSRYHKHRRGHFMKVPARIMACDWRLPHSSQTMLLWQP